MNPSNSPGAGSPRSRASIIRLSSASMSLNRWRSSGDIERIPSALLPRNFEPGFKVFLMNKDLDTFNTIAKELHVPVSFSNVAQRYQQAALAAGLGDKDTSVVMTIIEKLAALDVKAPK